MKTRLVIAVFAFTAVMPGWQIAHAQNPARAPTAIESVVQVHVHGLALQHRGDEKGAFIAFLDAAEHGYPPSQRKLGEIYDSGNSAVERDYEQSIRWYEKAREGGEVIPPPISHGSPFISPIRVAP
jgi:TPR repeat protein